MAAAAIALCCDRHPDRQVYREVAGTKMCRACFTGQDAPRLYISLEATIEEAQKFLPKIDRSVCVKCGAIRKPRGSTAMCTQCANRVNAIRQIKGRLRCYRQNRNAKYVQTAIALVRRYKIQPEELEEC